jgi:hypothetical protein
MQQSAQQLKKSQTNRVVFCVVQVLQSGNHFAATQCGSDSTQSKVFCNVLNTYQWPQHCYTGLEVVARLHLVL